MAYIGPQPVPRASRVVTDGTLASASQLIPVPGGFQPDNIFVYINGIRLRQDDYDDSSGTDVDLLEQFPIGTDYSIEEIRPFVSADLFTKDQLESSLEGTSGASLIGYDPTTSGLTSTQLQAALDEAVNNQLGWNQTWQDELANRSFDVTYTNTTGRPILVQAWTTLNTLTVITLYVDGLLVARAYGADQASMQPVVFVSAVVPDGGEYFSTSNASVPTGWVELK